MNSGPFLKTPTEFKANWIKILNIRLESINYIQGNIGRTLHDFEARGIFNDSINAFGQANGNKNLKKELYQHKKFLIFKRNDKDIYLNKKTPKRLGENTCSPLIFKIHKTLVETYKITANFINMIRDQQKCPQRRCMEIQKAYEIFLSIMNLRKI